MFSELFGGLTQSIIEFRRKPLPVTRHELNRSLLDLIVKELPEPGLRVEKQKNPAAFRTRGFLLLRIVSVSELTPVVPAPA